MKAHLLTFLFSLFFISIFGQGKKDTVYHFGNDSMVYKVSDDIFYKESVFVKADTLPSYPGGAKAWQEYEKNNFQKSVGFSGSLTIQFIVELDGTLSNISILWPKGFTNVYNKFIENFMLKGGNWFPAKQNGYVVRCYKRITIK